MLYSRTFAVPDCYIIRNNDHLTQISDVGAVNICDDNIELRCANPDAGARTLLEFYIGGSSSDLLDEHDHLYCSCELSYARQELKPRLRFHSTLCGSHRRRRGCHHQQYDEYAMAAYNSVADNSEYNVITVREAIAQAQAGSCPNAEDVCTGDGWVSVKNTQHITVSVDLDTTSIRALDFPGII